jgi:hypothetical protein
MTDQDEDRRKFLATCGRFAAVTPPVITVLLSTSLTSNAVAASMGHVGYGKGHGGYDHGNNNQGHNDNRGWNRRGDRDD